MQVRELITRLREDYLDDTLGVDTNDSLVTETALLRFATEAQDQVCRRQDLLYDETTVAVCTPTLVADQNNYTLHKAVTRLMRVSYNGNDLEHVTEDMLTAENKLWRSADSGTPTSYYMRGRTMYLYPAPSSTAIALASTLNLAVYRKPIIELKSDRQSFEIIEEAQDDLVYWMLYRVYNLRDEDLNDPESAKLYHGMFQESYGKVITMDVRIHQFESPANQTLRRKDGYSFTGHGSLDNDFDSTGWN